MILCVVLFVSELSAFLTSTARSDIVIDSNQDAELQINFDVHMLDMDRAAFALETHAATRFIHRVPDETDSSRTCKEPERESGNGPGEREALTCH
eukprot:3072600-Amphidinium_carterae.2